MNIQTLKRSVVRNAQKGITMIEYALIAAVVAAAIAGAFAMLTDGVSAKMNTIKGTLSSQAPIVITQPIA